MKRETHWNSIYRAKAANQLSWHARHLEWSLEMIRSVADLSAAIIDIGGGVSTLVDDLLDLGYSDISVLDVSAEALSIAKGRLGSRAEAITWFADDVISAALPDAKYDVWHDRAAFHFLADESDRRAYAGTAANSIKPGGHLIISAFAADGPTRCSGLEVVRYTARDLGRELGRAFVLEQESADTHVTPSSAEQAFVYCSFRRARGRT